DLLALRAVGLTPRQITAVIVSATAFVTLAAALAGTVLGVLASRWLIDLQGAASGWGTGIAQRPAFGVLALVIALAVTVSAAASALPAARAARRRLADSASAVL
ncbi:FtsX-like permease family protein, partial [Streptomyces lydicus]